MKNTRFKFKNLILILSVLATLLGVPTTAFGSEGSRPAEISEPSIVQIEAVDAWSRPCRVGSKTILRGWFWTVTMIDASSVQYDGMTAHIKAIKGNMATLTSSTAPRGGDLIYSKKFRLRC